MRHRLRALLPLSNRLHGRVVAGLALVALAAVSGVAGVSYLLAARAERWAAVQTAVTETAVLRQVIADRPAGQEPLTEILAGASGVEGLVLGPDGTGEVTTGGLTADAIPSPLPQVGTAVSTTVGGQRSLVTSSRLPGARQLVLVFDQAATQRSIAALRRSILAATAVMVAVLIVVLTAVSRRILDPVERTAQAAHRLAQGALGTRLGDDSPHLFADLTSAFDEMAGALEQTVHELRAMEAQQRRFVADVSHELRTPLQALSTAAELLEPAVGRLTGPQRRGAEALIQEVGRLRRMVEDLMEISRLDAGHPDLVLETSEIGELIRRLLSHRGLTGRIQVDVPDGLQLTTDRRRLDTILANLFGNAIVHGRLPIGVRASAQDGGIVIDVTDAGPGIPPQDRDRIFERFTKADPARTRSGGSGLGLAIAREHALVIGATLTLQTGTAGTTFRLVLPQPVDTEVQR